MCSYLTIESDQNVFCGRNLDFNRLVNSGVIFIPKNSIYYTVGSKLENNLEYEHKTKYDILGIGTNLLLPNLALYDAMNEYGLCGGQLYFREYAKYSEKIIPKITPVMPPYLVGHILANCKNISEVLDFIKSITLINRPLLGNVANLHFIFSDKSGESLVIEQTEDGLKTYRNHLGILTNSPSYSYHIDNLSNYLNLFNLDIEEKTFSDVLIKQSYSGSGLRGLPGDFSSPSRFVRLAFIKEYAKTSKSDLENVNYVFNMLGNVSFIDGLVKITNKSDVSKIDTTIGDYDYTIYSVVYDLANFNIYFKTYTNQQILVVDGKELNDNYFLEFNFKPEFKKIK